MIRKFFGKAEILKKLKAIGQKLPIQVRLYMIGGGAMGLRGEKDVTKDIDVVVTDATELKTFTETLKRLGYHEPYIIAREYENLRTAALLIDDEHFRFDVYLNTVCNALEFSENMKIRAEEYGVFGNLQLYLSTPEDIFLFKSITERDRDLEDMLTLLRKGIDENIIVEECKSQRGRSGRVWESFVAVKIEELERRFKITIPWKKQLLSVGEKATAKYLILDKIRAQRFTVKEIAQELDVSYNFVRGILKGLEARGMVTVDKDKKPYRYKIHKQNSIS